MKIFNKFILIFLTAIISVSTFGCSCTNKQQSANDNTVKYTDYDLVKDGKTEYRVVVPTDLDDYMNSTLMEFIYFFKLATNITIQNIDETCVSYSDDAKLIVLGNCKELLKTANVNVDRAKLGESGYVIETVGQNLFIVGGYRYGTVNGVYDLMRKIFNYEIYAVDEIVIDKDVYDKKLPDLKVEVIPDIDVLKPGAGIVINNRTYGMRLGYHGYDELVVPIKGPDGKLYNVHHDRFIVPFDEFGEEHPDWFGAAETITGRQLCYTNEEMYLQAYLPRAKNYIESYPNRSWFVVSQSDNTPMCKCATCKVEVDKYGSHSGIFVKFANKLAKDLNEWLEQQGSDRVIKVLCYAYQETMNPPVNYNYSTGKYTAIDESVIPNQNVYITMALSAQLPPISIYDERNSGCLSQIMGWASIAPALTCWSYGQTFENYFVPTNLYNSMSDIFKLMRDVKCVELSVQMQVDNLNSTDFYHLKVWLQSKLRWNADANIEALIKEYFEHYFGEASEEMLEFFNELRVWLSYLEGYTNYGVGQQVNGNEDRKFWPKGLLDNFIATFKSAERSIEPLKNTDSERYNKIYDRIQLETLSYRYILMNNYESYYTEAEALEIKKGIKNDILRLNITKLRDGATGTSDLVYNGWNV